MWLIDVPVKEINNYQFYRNNKDNVKPGYIKYKDSSGLKRSA